MDTSEKDETRLYAFVDETGTNELDSSKEGVSNLFVLVAVVVDHESKSIVEAGVREMSRKLCGGAEVASKRIGANHKKRLKYLESIKELPFTYYALVINKDKIFRDSGLKYKKSFYKYFNRMLYESLLVSGKSISITADQIGGQDFMDSFKAYFKEKGMRDLFQDYDPLFADSAQTPLIQLADLIAGTLSYCFDAKKRSEYRGEFRALVAPKEIGIQSWPLSLSGNSKISLPEQPFEADLENSMCRRVERFIEEHMDGSDLDRHMQAVVLSYLFFARSFEEKDQQSLISDNVREMLRQRGLDDPGKQGFQSRIIGKIRDAGITLAGGFDGIRLALSVNDINDYLHHDLTMMEPMISRVNRARESVLADTGMKYDILDAPGYEFLKVIAEKGRESLISRRAMPTDLFPD